MQFRISVCCCNYLFSAGIKQLIEGNERAMDYRIGIVDPEDITAKTDLIIADYHSLSRMSIETLVKHKVGDPSFIYRLPAQDTRSTSIRIYLKRTYWCFASQNRYLAVKEGNKMRSFGGTLA